MIDLLLLDRDGVINEKIHGDYVRNPSQLLFIESTFHFLANHKENFKNVGIVTNQQGIGKKLFTQKDLNEIHEKVTNQFIKYDLIKPEYFVCPHLSGECECRKPKPNLIIEALEHFKASKRLTLMIGDSNTDVGAAKSAGIRVVHLESHCDEYICDSISHELTAEIFDC